MVYVFWLLKRLPDVRVPAGVSLQFEDCHVVVEGPGIVVRVSDDSLHAVGALVRFVIYGKQRQVSLSKESKVA